MNATPLTLTATLFFLALGSNCLALDPTHESTLRQERDVMVSPEDIVHINMLMGDDENINLDSYIGTDSVVLIRITGRQYVTDVIAGAESKSVVYDATVIYNYKGDYKRGYCFRLKLDAGSLRDSLSSGPSLSIPDLRVGGEYALNMPKCVEQGMLDLADRWPHHMMKVSKAGLEQIIDELYSHYPEMKPADAELERQALIADWAREGATLKQENLKLHTPSLIDCMGDPLARSVWNDIYRNTSKYEYTQSFDIEDYQLILPDGGEGDEGAEALCIYKGRAKGRDIHVIVPLNLSVAADGSMSYELPMPEYEGEEPNELSMTGQGIVFFNRGQYHCVAKPKSRTKKIVIIDLRKGASMTFCDAYNETNARATGLPDYYDAPIIKD